MQHILYSSCIHIIYGYTADPEAFFRYRVKETDLLHHMVTVIYTVCRDKVNISLLKCGTDSSDV